MSGAVLELELLRALSLPDRTLGRLRWPTGRGGTGACATLEDTDRRLEELGEAEAAAMKAAHLGETAIPLGRYRLVWAPSPSRGHNTLRIEGVPGFHGILIHNGNRPADSLGCILVGERHGNEVWYSRSTLGRLEADLVPQLEAGAVAWLTIRRFADIPLSLRAAPPE